MSIMTDDQLGTQLDLLRRASDEQRKTVAIAATHAMSTPAAKKEVATAVAHLGPPTSRRTTNTIWLIIVFTFALVFFGAAATLMWGRFFPVMSDGEAVMTSSDMILTLVTTASAFLAGLIAPSPVRGGDNGSQSG